MSRLTKAKRLKALQPDQMALSTWRAFFERAKYYLNTHTPEEFAKVGIRAAKDKDIDLVMDEEYGLLMVLKPKATRPSYDELYAHWKATKIEGEAA